MKIVFLGVGEAFDENFSNNSLLILSDTKILLDCGGNTPYQLWKYNSDQSFLDAVFISHAHADHYFGLPALLVRMWEEKRTKPLAIICQKGNKKIIEELIEYGYKGFGPKLGFNINFIEVEEGEIIEFNEFKMSFSFTDHSIENLAVKIENGRNSVCYSGDGMFNEKTKELYKNCDLLIGESYLFDEKIIGHCSIKDLIAMAKENNVKCAALTHINRNLRKSKIEEIRKISEQDIKVIIPEEFEEYDFE